jgi:hypothetical protein
MPTLIYLAHSFHACFPDAIVGLRILLVSHVIGGRNMVLIQLQLIGQAIMLPDIILSVIHVQL